MLSIVIVYEKFPEFYEGNKLSFYILLTKGKYLYIYILLKTVPYKFVS